MSRNLFIGADVGGTHMRAALIDAEGRVLLRRKVLTDGTSDPERASGRLILECRSLVGEAGGLGGRVAAAGLGVAGKIDRVGGRVLFSPHLPAMRGYPLALELERALEIPVVMENDANAFGIGEAWLGAGRGIDHWIGLTLGTGVGGCLIMDGRLWQGDGLGFVAEMGHMVIQPEGPQCACGLRGCLEAHASASALLRGVRDAVENGLASGLLYDLWREGGLTAERIHCLAQEGDPLARSLFDRAGWALGLALANLFTVLGIRTAVIGGGVSAGWELFIGPLETSLAAHSSMLEASRAVIRRGVLGDDAALLGSARLAFDTILGP